MIQPLSEISEPTMRNAAVSPIGKFTMPFNFVLMLPPDPVYEVTPSPEAAKTPGSGALGTILTVPPMELEPYSVP